ncbi:MAG: hypothetical protein A2445_04545 [Candidatus Jacksonbacteria bacterium RIFOXYC2_FULL_44_29]|nr:MAG: Aspartyl/glutamyl-tRNA(Asn/Gln) amidotransferase subunit C [Parcubacteria group bacterium GW2011_GWA2_42_28]KKT55850.1 MAG: Aspartyl/glutamyl-tRNA(Asn/Gln) amidotransferase subunit C [Parcubacteria group bacterium GW2011_GWC2_44_22]OGY75628.1 MAG: hypothetical protein A2240_03735 [Candidatus Jacksonbacteria bacterium RIFOXYA2_FULL_43_12]OGY76601.1 MAG: hypothetical protein A2295_01475 [Candidatus Jacksonbacteria bacterium RIFOXYB2_FULL_44_15]OGY78326.1 MAG: hypothetical protein A2445_04
MTTQEAQKIAKLARLYLTEEELEKYSQQLSVILDYIDSLNQVDTSQVQITSQVTGLTNVWREDKITASLITSELLEQAPELEQGGVKVKSVF